jgi:hypothetical protein
MIGCQHRKASETKGLINLMISLLGLLMLISFPIRSAHQFENHFRTPEVRRSIERHTAIVNPESKAPERISYQGVLPSFLKITDAADVPYPVARGQVSDHLEFPHLYPRLKLGSSRSGSQDPLL